MQSNRKYLPYPKIPINPSIPHPFEPHQRPALALLSRIDTDMRNPTTGIDPELDRRALEHHVFPKLFDGQAAEPEVARHVLEVHNTA